MSLIYSCKLVNFHLNKRAYPRLSDRALPPPVSPLYQKTPLPTHEGGSSFLLRLDPLDLLIRIPEEGPDEGIAVLLLGKVFLRQAQLPG